MLWGLFIVMKNKEATRYYSTKQENYIANLLNCKRQCGSGSTPYNKGDIFYLSGVECIVTSDEGLRALDFLKDGSEYYYITLSV